MYAVPLQLRILAAPIIAVASLLSNNDRIHITLEIDLGEDVGQNFGTLFEMKDAQGEPIMGAGFLGAYNTRDRADRHVVQFFVKSGADETTIESLPRPTTDCGVYLSDLDGKLYARSVFGGKDSARRVWNPHARSWRLDENDAQTRMRVAGKLLEFRANEARYDGEPILTWNGHGQMDPFYYANGQLIVRHRFTGDNPRNGRLIALNWTPTSKTPVDPANGTVLELPTQGAFTYACGQLGDELLITTNIGGVHRLTAEGWDTLRHTDGKSYQVYAALNTYDRLWLGQYPTGHALDFRNGKIAQIDNHPPRMPNVSPNARELQTLTIYRGDIYAGVWPWGEVWRYRHGVNQWEFVKRLFTHPKPTDATVHPYDKETATLEPVANLWGQRISGMIPLCDSLYIATSAKGTPAYDPKFKFLADDKWKEYGMVYRLRLPGHLSVPIQWKTERMRLEFIVDQGKMRIVQDGKELGVSKAPAFDLIGLNSPEVVWGRGLFGRFAGKILHCATLKTGAPSVPEINRN